MPTQRPGRLQALQARPGLRPLLLHPCAQEDRLSVALDPGSLLPRQWQPGGGADSCPHPKTNPNTDSAAGCRDVGSGKRGVNNTVCAVFNAPVPPVSLGSNMLPGRPAPPRPAPPLTPPITWPLPPQPLATSPAGGSIHFIFHHRTGTSTRFPGCQAPRLSGLALLPNTRASHYGSQGMSCRKAAFG